jgi:uncharacterized membrane protein
MCYKDRDLKEIIDYLEARLNQFNIVQTIKVDTFIFMKYIMELTKNRKNNRTGLFACALRFASVKNELPLSFNICSKIVGCDEKYMTSMMGKILEIINEKKITFARYHDSKNFLQNSIQILKDLITNTPEIDKNPSFYVESYVKIKKFSNEIKEDALSIISTHPGIKMMMEENTSEYCAIIVLMIAIKRSKTHIILPLSNVQSIKKSCDELVALCGISKTGANEDIKKLTSK